MHRPFFFLSSFSCLVGILLLLIGNEETPEEGFELLEFKGLDGLGGAGNMGILGVGSKGGKVVGLLILVEYGT